MIQTSQREAIIDTLNRAEPPGVSLTMPVIRARVERKKNGIVLKNLLKKARRELRLRGESTKTVRRLLRPLQQRIKDHPFWRAQDRGLAIFRSPGLHREFSLPVGVPEQVTVGPRFQVIPLLPALSDDEYFFVLTLHRREARLYRGSQSDFYEWQKDGFPFSGTGPMEDQDPQEALQFHTGAPPAGGKRGAVFHGHGGGEDVQREEEILMRFLRSLDRRLESILSDRDVPLLLVGPEEVVAQYRRLSSLSQMLEPPITRHPEDLSVTDIEQLGRSMMQSRRAARRKQRLNTFQRLKNSEKTSVHLKQVVAACSQGRVSILFVSEDERIWGQFDEQKQEAVLGAPSIKSNFDLVDFSAAAVIQHGGEVILLPREKMPGKAALAAVFRY